jgi:hypothetical protein
MTRVVDKRPRGFVLRQDQEVRPSQSSVHVELEDCAVFAFIQCVQPLHGILAHFKVKNVHILLDSLRIRALGQRHPAFLYAVSNQNLGRGLAVRLRNITQGRIVEAFACRQRTVCLHGDTVVAAVLDQVPLLAPRM